MKIQILAFGIAKDIVGGATLDFEIPEGTNVAQLKRQLQKDYPSFTELTSLAIAINSEYAQDEQQISERDEVVLIPPVSGG